MTRGSGRIVGCAGGSFRSGSSLAAKTTLSVPRIPASNGEVVIAPSNTVSGLTHGIYGAASGSGNVTVMTSQDVARSQTGSIVGSVVDGRITLNRHGRHRQRRLPGAGNPDHCTRAGRRPSQASYPPNAAPMGYGPYHF